MTDDFLTRLQISDSGFVFDPHTGSTFSLNRTGVRLIQLMKDGRDNDQIIETMAGEYGIEPATARRDLEDFAMSVKALGG